MKKIAIIGASGFVGLRLVERLHLGGIAQVVPVVHAYRSLAVLARFDLPWRVADPADETALAEALRGCDAVVHVALADAAKIVTMAKALVPAAARAGVKRVVYLSSAAVHGLAPAEGTDETTPPLLDQASEYNVAKARAELALTAARAAHPGVELVTLRPGIIHGPRSRLVADLARQLLGGTAYLVNGGHGICNAIAVDNLIDAILLGLERPGVGGETFLVNDRETVTWYDFYATIASAVGADLGAIHSVGVPTIRISPGERLARFAAKPAMLSLLPLIPSPLKRMAKASAAAWPEPPKPNPWKLVDPRRPQPSAELTLLQSNRWRFPTHKAETKLGFLPDLSFTQATARTAAWLRYIGVARPPRPQP